MVTDHELKRLLDGRYKSLTPETQREMAILILGYREACRKLLEGGAA